MAHTVVEVRQVPNLLTADRPSSRAIINRAIREYDRVLPCILDLRRSGKSLDDIAKALNAAGHRTRKDCLFSKKTVQKILDRSGYVTIY